MKFSPGDEVIFKREKITKEMLSEFGTSAVYLSYKVTRQLENVVFIKSKIGFEFDVSVDDIELKPRDFNQVQAIAPFLDTINKLEKVS